MIEPLDMLATKLVEQLHLSLQTVATAESCTGGLVADSLTNIPGASAVFLEGVVCYSNAAKSRLLGVPPELIAQYGAVSAAVAQAMAEGVQARSGATFGLATTGIAGPSGGEEAKPVGTLFLAIAQHGKATQVWRELFPGERLRFKRKATETLLSRFLERLLCFSRGRMLLLTEEEHQEHEE
jgi:PncC family amidohydrolase